MAARPGHIFVLLVLLSATIITTTQAFFLHRFHHPTSRRTRGRRTMDAPGAESPTIAAAAPRETDTGLFGTLRFAGDAEITADIPPGGASLARFFASEAADPILVGVTNDSSTYRRLESDYGGDGTTTTLECRQKSLTDFLGLTLTPVLTSRITKSVDEGGLVVDILDARTEVSEGRIGNTLRRLLERAKFVGSNRVSWTEHGGGYRLVARMDLLITVDLPPLLPLPPGFNSLGSRIVRSQSRGRLQESVDDIARAYREWSESERRKNEIAREDSSALVEPVLS